MRSDLKIWCQSFRICSFYFVWLGSPPSRTSSSDWSLSQRRFLSCSSQLREEDCTQMWRREGSKESLFGFNNKQIFCNFVGQKTARLDYLFLDGSRATFEMLKKLYKEISQSRSLAKLNYNFMAKFTKEKLFSWSWAWLVLVIIKWKHKSSYISFRINHLSSP